MELTYGCQQDILNLPTFETKVIEYLCREANSLKNCAIFALKRSSRQIGRVDFNYESLDKYFKDEENKHYRNLFSQVAQQALIEVCESFKSYSELLQMWFTGELNDRPSKPHYRKSGGLSGISYPAQHIIKDSWDTGMFRLPLGNTIKNEEGVDAIFIPAPTNIDPDTIREVRILPRNKTFYIEYIYVTDKPKYNLKPNNALGIDPGVKNWLTCVSTLGDSFIIDGQQANFWNFKVNSQSQRYNKGFWSRNLALTYEKRNRRMRDYINKIARKIADYCIENDIGTVVFGWNQGIKDSINIGKSNNRNFVLLPHSKLKERLKTVLTEIGINFVETEEANTSAASFLDGDDLYKHGEKPEGWKASGRRIKTKLYRTAKGWLINADCNGAANILRKAVGTGIDLDLSNVTRGVVTSPRRIRLAMLNQRNFSITNRVAA